MSALNLLKSIPKERILDTQLKCTTYKRFLTAITVSAYLKSNTSTIPDDQNSSQGCLLATTTEIVSILLQADNTDDSFVVTTRVLFPILSLAGRLEILMEHRVVSLLAWSEFLRFSNLLITDDYLQLLLPEGLSFMKEGLVQRLRGICSSYISQLCANNNESTDACYISRLSTNGVNRLEAQYCHVQKGFFALDRLVSSSVRKLGHEVWRVMESHLEKVVSASIKNKVSGSLALMPLSMLILVKPSIKGPTPNIFKNLVKIIVNSERFPKEGLRISVDLFTKWFLEEIEIDTKTLTDSAATMTKQRCLNKMFLMTLCNPQVRLSNERLLGAETYEELIRTRFLSKLLTLQVNENMTFLSSIIHDATIIERQELWLLIFGKDWLQRPLTSINLPQELTTCKGNFLELLSSLENLPLLNSEQDSACESIYEVLKEVEQCRNKFIEDHYGRNTLEGTLLNLSDYFEQILTTNSALDRNIALCPTCVSEERTVCTQCIVEWTKKSWVCQAACQFVRVCECISDGISAEILLRISASTEYYTNRRGRLWILWGYASNDHCMFAKQPDVRDALVRLPDDLDVWWPLLIRMNLIQKIGSPELLRRSLPSAMYIIDHCRLDPTVAQQAVYLQAQKIIKSHSIEDYMKATEIAVDPINNYYRFQIEKILMNTKIRDDRALSVNNSLFAYLPTPVLSNLGLYCIENLTSQIVYPDINVFLGMVPLLESIAKQVAEGLIRRGIIPGSQSYNLSQLIGFNTDDDCDNLFRDEKEGTLERHFADRLMSLTTGISSSFSGYLCLVNSSIGCLKYGLLIHVSQPRGLLSRIRQCWSGMETALKYTCISSDLIQRCFDVIEEVFIPYAPDFSIRMIKGSFLPYINDYLKRFPSMRSKRPSLSDRLQSFLENVTAIEADIETDIETDIEDNGPA